MRNTAWVLTTALLSIAAILGCSGAGGDSSTSSAPGPMVAGVLPQANFNQAGQTDPVSASFDETMSPASPATFVVNGYLTGRLAGAYSGGGSTTLQFASADSFGVGEEVEVSLAGALTSSAGRGLEPPFVYRFRVETADGTGTFDKVQTVAAQLDAIALAAGDWDKDGDVDLAAANFGSSSVGILKNDGTGSFSQSGSVAMQIAATAMAAGDWDGDGDLDLAVANFGANQVAILENNGADIFTVAGTDFGQVNVSALAAGDWGGDGALDLAAANKGADSVDVLKKRLP